MENIEKGFAQPVFDAQYCFRRILTALSEPGTKVTLDKHSGFAPLNAAASQVLMSLCDAQVGIYLSSTLSEQAQSVASSLKNLSFHHGVASKALNEADFIVIDGQQAFNFNDCKAGCEMYPEDSATIVVQCGAFNEGPECRISGPGIEQPITLRLGKLNEQLRDYLSAPTHRYPMGIDFMFCADQQLVAISRTSKVEFLACM